MLEGKVVIVTGSAKGIGRHAARTFAETRAKVVVADFDRDRLQRTAGELSQTTEALGIALDVRDEEDVRRMVGQVLDRFGRIDVLVNNAAIVPHFAWGIPRWPRISEMPKDFWDRVIQTNLNGTFLCTKYVIPHMEKSKAGHVINLYGGGGVTPAGACAYMVTKDGLRTLTRYVAEEVRASNICVVIFSPRVPIATEGAPEEALKRLPGPEVLGQGFVLAAELPMEQSGGCFAYQDGKLVNEAPRD
jgi:NAD(P)-dependent dehydrogenase (short-subunit alcohol dehydrogenase family)